MKNLAFLIGGFIFLIITGVDALMFLSGMKVLGIFSFIASLLVFSSGMIWLIYRDDGNIYFRRPHLLIPIAIFGEAIVEILERVPVNVHMTAENLEEVGSLLMSRYQIALWMTAILIFFIFVMASSLMGGERQ